MIKFWEWLVIFSNVSVISAVVTYIVVNAVIGLI